MSENNTEKIKQLIDQLSNEDGQVRSAAREELVQIGGPEVTQALMLELIDTRPYVRWEAAKGLVPLRDASSAASLLNAMDDENADVRWVAGEGLVALGNAGLMTVLSGLIRNARSIQFCRAAHHVLNEFKKYGNAELIVPVVNALEHSEPAVTVPPLAYAALRKLKP